MMTKQKSSPILDDLTNEQALAKIKQVSDTMVVHRNSRARLSASTPHGRDSIRMHSRAISRLNREHKALRALLKQRGVQRPGL